MKKILMIALLMVGWGCAEDDITDSSGTRLLAIDYASNGQAWTEDYHYRADGTLAQIEDRRSLGRRYELEYQDTTLVQIFTYQIEEDGALIFRDSLVYTEGGRLQRIYNFSRNAGAELPLDWVYEYSYDLQGRVVERRNYYANEETPLWYEKYYWEGSNIVRKEEYHEEGKLYYKYFYTYDDQNNYMKPVVPYLYDPINWSANNVTVMDYLDYYGNLDLFCRPCVTSYRYNRDGYPVAITTKWGQKMRLTYE